MCNGMFVLNRPSDVQNIVIGLVLIVAVVVDALTHRVREAEGES